MCSSFSILKFDQHNIQEQEGYLDMMNNNKIFKDFVKIGPIYKLL